MPIFNSLGSNYDFGFVIRALFVGNDKRYHEELKSFLEKKYGGEAMLVYKGREALRLALRVSNLKGATVGICGFTCFAVYDAIVKEGYTVEYLDIEKNTLHFSYDTFKKHLERNPKIKVLVIQNTLGYPCEIERIAELCKEKKVILIEDLAHSIGSVYDNGKEVGTIGDFVVLSFSQDKVVDGVSGGALIVRNDKFKPSLSLLRKQKSMDSRLRGNDKIGGTVGTKRQVIDRLYPLLTFLIRKTYASGLGKALHIVLKQLHLLSNPMSSDDSIHALPAWYSGLIYHEFLQLEKNLDHRRKIASIYVSSLRAKRSNPLGDRHALWARDDVMQLSTNLRFPIFAKEREALITHLKKNNIFISDIWYDSPIAPKKYLQRTNYTGQCHNAEEVSSQIVNLPTHRNVSEKDAQVIAQLINKWLP